MGQGYSLDCPVLSGVNKVLDLLQEMLAGLLPAVGPLSSWVVDV